MISHATRLKLDLRSLAAGIGTGTSLAQNGLSTLALQVIGKITHHRDVAIEKEINDRSADDHHHSSPKTGEP